ncbi:Dirigent protein 11 [Sesamum alatum]|uniref:Dirigent protein n=1 Tax=Sesamum alatum TaxID=300844 RepID=A0AAE2CWX5_9LAMI|nr:Dirigent protein 11 [Sesamum alatum]
MEKLIFLGFMVISSLSLAIFPRGYASQTDPLYSENDESWFHDLSHGHHKTAKLHFYVQDLLKGENQTVHEVARAEITSNSATSFGSVRVLDNPMTAGPDINSTPVGRFQGLVTSADLEILSFVMNINFVFTAGRFRGSTISISGMNQVMSDRRELPVIGGTGAFRFARGYVITTTYSADMEKGYNVLEYTIYVNYGDEFSMGSCDHANI